MQETGDGRSLGRRLLNQVKAFNYTTVPNAPTYRAIVQVCYEATQRYVVALRPADIWQAVEESGYVVEVRDVDELLETQYLASLHLWGNLARTADSAGVDRLTDFYRRRLLYHLTDVGEAAHRGAGGRGDRLPVRVAADQHAGQDPRRAGVCGARRRPRGARRALHDVHGAFETLTQEANRFMTDLGRLVGDDGGGPVTRASSRTSGRC